MDIDEIRIKKCPACENEAGMVTGNKKISGYIMEDFWRAYAYVECKTCGMRTKTFEDSKGDGQFILDAVETWNTRPEYDNSDNDSDDRMKNIENEIPEEAQGFFKRRFMRGL